MSPTLNVFRCLLVTNVAVSLALEHFELTKYHTIKATQKLLSPLTISDCNQGRIQGAHPARAPPKIGKNMIFLA
jgi:hypothetical protein